jgi:hypothetical protein
MTVNLNAFPTATGPMSTKHHIFFSLRKRHFIYSQQAGPSRIWNVSPATCIVRPSGNSRRHLQDYNVRCHSP